MAESTSSKIVRQSIWKFISTVIGKVGALIFIIFIARLLKPDGFGIYNLAMSIALIFATFADSGINQTLVRYVSYALGKNKKSQAAAYLQYLFKIKLILVVSLSLAMLILAYPLSFYIFKKPQLFWPLIILSFYLIISVLQGFFEKLFYAIKNLKYLPLKEAIFQSSKILLVLLIFATLIESRIVGVIIAVVLANLLVLLFLLVVLKKLTPYIFQKTSEKIPKKRVLNFLKYMVIGSLSGVFFGYIDMIMLGIFVKAEYIGYYAAALTLILSILSFFSFSSLLIPTFTQLNKSKLKEGFDRVFKYVCLLTIPLIFGALILGKYVIRIVYGHDYLIAILPFSFLAFFIFAFILIDVIISLFSAREKPKYFVKILLVATFLNIVLNYILITSLLKISSEWAIGGAAIATLFSNYFYLGFLMILAHKKFHVSFKISYVIKPLVASLFMFLILTIINNFIKNMNIIFGIFEIFLGVLIYLAIMVLIEGLTKQDYQIIKETLKLK